MKKLLTLFLTFLKIGAFTFGGGYAMTALLENEFTEKKKWLGKEEFIDVVAIAESTPGPIAVNSATYIGYKTAGIPGAAISTFAVCIPSFLIIFVISLFLDKFLSFKYVAYAFKGIQVCVVYLIFSAGLRILKSIKKNVFNVLILVCVAALMIAFSVFSVSFSSIFYILICGCLGVFAYLIEKLRQKGETKK